jgi:hypothetical protein
MPQVFERVCDVLVREVGPFAFLGSRLVVVMRLQRSPRLIRFSSVAREPPQTVNFALNVVESRHQYAPLENFGMICGAPIPACWIFGEDGAAADTAERPVFRDRPTLVSCLRIATNSSRLTPIIVQVASSVARSVERDG